MAEQEGFEPSVQQKLYAGFRIRQSDDNRTYLIVFIDVLLSCAFFTKLYTKLLV